MPSCDLAALLIDARRTGTPFDLLPEIVPASIEEAYAVSAQVAAGLGEMVAGWKVGQLPDGRAMAAPMLAAGLRASGARWTLNPRMPLIPEVEIAVRLARDIPPRPGKPYCRDEIRDSLSEVLIGLELIARRFTPNAETPQAALLADDLGNCGFVAGPCLRARHSLDLAAIEACLRIGDEWHAGRPHPMGDPLIPLITWACEQCDRLGGLRAGQIVTLGSLTPTVVMHAPAAVEGEIAGLGTVTVDVVG
jgi:2-keto-4-pentenoate hydratase